MSKNDITRDTLRTRGPSKEYDEGYARIFGTKIPQAECAPREAQPVGPRTTLNYDGTFDTTCAHCGGNGCFACLKSAAPTPERADADTAGAKPWWHALAKAADAVSKSADVWHGFSIQDAKVCVDAYLAASASERADAGKDAALTDERAKEIAQQVHAECSRIPGATFYNAAISAIEQAVKERK
jgi:hypothetical protein